MKRPDYLIILLLSVFGGIVAYSMFGTSWGIVGLFLGAGIAILWLKVFPTIRPAYAILILLFALMGAMIFGALWGPFGAIIGLLIGGGVMVGLIACLMLVIRITFRNLQHRDRPSKKATSAKQNERQQ